METLFDGIEVGAVSASMTTNAPGAITPTRLTGRFGRVATRRSS
jgi:methylmalonyl-CoA mutase N-terminal domain/subunit